MKTDNSSTDLSSLFSAQHNLAVSLKWHVSSRFSGTEKSGETKFFLDVTVALSKRPSPVDNILGVNPLRSLNISY